ncbi:DoxX family protein [Fulvivirga sp. M361]|uniref:DoxX family protein n=1 Tax=Fulvivirga sp. M361 TaxID=2594266 RepID=UPI00117BDBFB|nr:DoxX family protein [Fulvivirga sp. M361]TRX60560.1 DoxX family protein [Fulvivirga sp. M361]
MLKKLVLSTDINPGRLHLSLLAYRVLISLSLFNTHGIKKALNFEETLAHIPDPLGVGSAASAYFALLANVICPAFIALGLFTRAAIIPVLSITLMGFFVVHISDPWPVKDVPLMYSITFLLLLILGPGKYALDHKLFNQQK